MVDPVSLFGRCVLTFNKLNMRQAYGVWVSSSAAAAAPSIKLIFTPFIQTTVLFVHSKSVVTFSLASEMAEMRSSKRFHTNWSIHHTHNFVVTVRSLFTFFFLFTTRSLLHICNFFGTIESVLGETSKNKKRHHFELCSTCLKFSMLLMHNIQTQEHVGVKLYLLLSVSCIQHSY